MFEGTRQIAKSKKYLEEQDVNITALKDDIARLMQKNGAQQMTILLTLFPRTLTSFLSVCTLFNCFYHCLLSLQAITCHFDC